MNTPLNIHEELLSSRKPILVGKLKVFPPGGKTKISKQELRDGRWSTELAVVQQFDVNEDGKTKKITIMRAGSQLHRLWNRYFAKPLDRNEPWQFLGESDDDSNLFPIQVPELEVGTYVFMGILTGELGEYVYIAEDSILVEVTP